MCGVKGRERGGKEGEREGGREGKRERGREGGREGGGTHTRLCGVWCVWSCRIDESLCRVDDSMEAEESTLIPYDRCDTRATEGGQTYLYTHRVVLSVEPLDKGHFV